MLWPPSEKKETPSENMKRIWNSIGKPTKNSNYQVKAVKHIEDAEKGIVKLEPAPHHKSEMKHFDEAQKDDEVRKIINSKSESLIENMNKITIRSTNPPERWTSSKEFPSRESEFLHRNDPVWEFGFYEPEIDKIPKGKLMYREALELLRSMQEADTTGDTAAAAALRERGSASLESHVATKRVGREKIEEMFQYFRPFERRDTQKVVSRFELAQLQEALHGREDSFSLTEGAHKGLRRMAERATKQGGEWESRLNPKEQQDFEDAVKQLRSEEHDRLQERLKDIHKMEEEFDEAVKKVQEEKKK